MEEYIIIEQETDEMKENGMEFFSQQVEKNGVGTPGHIHDFIEIILVTAGSFRIFVDEAEYAVQKGDIVLFRSNTIHGIYANSLPVNEYYVLKVKPSLFFELASEKNVISYLLRFVIAGKDLKTHWNAEELSGSEIADAVEKLMAEYSSETLCRDISLKICAYRIILSLLRDMMCNEGSSRQTASDNITAQIYRSIMYINQYYKEDIYAEDCAKNVNMSYSYFSRCFKRITGSGFKEYLNEVRIRHAEQLLMTTDLSVTQIASECGYNNVSYFISVYRSLRGDTPLCSRKSHLFISQ